MSCVWWKVCFFVFNTFFGSFEFFPCRLRFEKKKTCPLLGPSNFEAWPVHMVPAKLGCGNLKMWTHQATSIRTMAGSPTKHWRTLRWVSNHWMLLEFFKNQEASPFPQKKTLKLNLWNTITHHNCDPLHAQVLAQRLCRQPWFAMTWVRVGFFEGEWDDELKFLQLCEWQWWGIVFSFQDTSDTSMSWLRVNPNGNPFDLADLCVKSLERQKVYGLSKSHSSRGQIFSSSCEANKQVVSLNFLMKLKYFSTGKSR